MIEKLVIFYYVFFSFCDFFDRNVDCFIIRNLFVNKNSLKNNGFIEIVI